MKKAMNHSEVKEFLPSIEQYGFGITRKDRLEKTERCVIVDGIPMFFFLEGRPIPTIKALMKNPVLKTLTVDMGAIRFVTAGADIMRPGITAIDEGIKKGDVVAVKDVSHGKILAVGMSLFSSEELQEMKSGKAVKNLHWVGDEIWNLST
jgi:PUA-domain protein